MIFITLHRCNGNYSLHSIPASEIPYFRKFQDPECHHFGCITGLKGDAINYASRASSSQVQVLKGHSVKNGKILKCNMTNTDNKLYLGFVADPAFQEERIDVRLQFELKNFYFERLCSIISRLRNDMIARIIPEQNDFLACNDIMLDNKYTENLDEFQAQAFKMIVSARKRSPPVLLTGPFGCGKTLVLAKSSLYFLNEDHDFENIRILACTQQQVSADAFFECFTEQLTFRDPELCLVRLGGANSRQGSSIESKYFKTVDLTYDEIIGRRKKKTSHCYDLFNCFYSILEANFSEGIFYSCSAG